MAKMGRPKTKIDLKLVEELAHIQCTSAEIAAILKIPQGTLTKREDFTEAFKRGKEGGKKSLRRHQFELSKRSAAMGIWLGKQYLGQKDIPDQDEIEKLLQWNSIKNVASCIAPNYMWTRLHRFLAQKAEEFISAYRYGQAPFFILNMPSQHGKTFISRMMAALLISQMPGTKAGYVSYGTQFATRNGTKPIRDILTQNQSHLFSKNCEKSSKYWRTTSGGGMVAASPAGGLTGEPLDFLLMDDLDKNYSEYLSDATRIRNRDFIEGVVRQRLNNDSAVWVIATRWGIGDGVDLCRELLGGERKPITINLPAIAQENDILGREPGEPLFPEMHSLEKLIHTKQLIHPLKWAAMYMGNPESVTGPFFIYDRWIQYEKLPPEKDLHTGVRYWDLAFTRGGHSCVGAKLRHSRIGEEYADCGECFQDAYIEHLNIMNGDWPANQTEIIRQAREDGPGVIIGIEANGPQIGPVQLIQKELGDEFQVWFRTTKPDKREDARYWQLQQQQGRVRISDKVDLDKFKNRSKKFPQDDIDEIDAISGAMWMQRRLTLSDGMMENG